MRIFKATLILFVFAVTNIYGATAAPQGNSDNIKSPGSGEDYYWNDALTGVYVSDIDMSASSGYSNGSYWVKILNGSTYNTMKTSTGTGTIDYTITSSQINNLGLSGGTTFYIIVIRESQDETSRDTSNIQSYEYRNVSGSDASATNAPALQAAYDTGPSSSDGYTNLTSLVFDITGATTSEHVKLWSYYYNTKLDEDENTASSSFTLGATLSVGDNTVHTETINQYGNRATSGYDYIFVDQTAPSALIVSSGNPSTTGEWNLHASDDAGISSTDYLTNDPTPRIILYSSDLKVNPSGNVGSSDGRATIYVDGTAVDSSDGDGDYYLIITMSSLSDGTYSITHEIIDPGGNRSGQSSPFSLTIDTEADASGIAIDLDQDSEVDTGFDQTDHYTSDTTPTFNLTGSGATGVQAGDSIIVKNGSTWIAGGWAATAGSIALTVPSASALAEGTYSTLSVFVVDSAGNTSSSGNTLSPDLVVDTTDPADPSSAPSLKTGHDTGTLSNDRLTNRRTPTFVFAAEASTDSIYVYQDGTKVAAALANATSNIEIAIPDVGADGTYAITYTDVDKAGNESNASAAFSVRVDSTAPTAIQSINMVEDEANDTGESQTDKITRTQNPQFQIILADASTSIADADSVILYFTDKSDGSTNAVDAEIITADPHTIQPTSNQDEGSYFVTAAVLDSAGNLRDSTGLYQSITIDRSGPDAPTGIDLQTADDSGKSDSDDITLETTLVFTVSGVTSGDSVFVLFGTDTVGRGKASSTTADVTVNTASEGTHNVKSIAKDPAGNLGTASSTLISGLIVDITKPTKPTNLDLVDASDTGINSSDGITNDNTPTFTADGLNAADSVDIYFGSKVSVGSITVSGPVDADGTINLTPASTVTDGEYWVRVKAIDPAGNTSDASDSVYIQIDTDNPNAPTITGILPVDDSGHHNNDGYTYARQPTIIVTNLDATENDSVRVFYTGNTAAVDSVVANGHGGTDYLKPESDLPEGVFTLRAVAIDSAGNVSDTTTTANGYVLKIDLTDPNSITGADLVKTSDTGVDTTDNLTSDTTPTFKITSTDGFVGDSVFVVMKKGSLQDSLGIGFVASGNTVSITINAIDTAAAVFGNGSIETHAYAVDSAGNISTTLAGASLLNITLDTQAPTAPTLDLIAADDSGVLDNDNLTNIVNPRFSVTGSGGTDSVIVAATTDTVGRDVANADPYTVSTSNVAGGLYSYTAKLRDYAGNLSLASAAVSVEIDTTPPEKPNSAPDLLTAVDSGWVSNTDNITNVAQPYFVLTGVSPTDPGKIDSLFLLKDSTTILASSWSSQLVTDTLQSSTLSSGTYKFNVFSMDSAGNISDTSAVLSPVVIDLADPSTPSEPDLLASSDLGVADNDNITKDSSPTFRTANLESGTQMKFYVIDNTSTTIDSIVSVISADSTGTNFTLTEGSIPEGTYSFYATSEDTSGNKVQSTALTNVILDYTAPVCSLTFTNTTQTHITNLGKYQDQISLVAKFTESAGTNPAPVLNVQYADSTTDSFSGTAGIGSNNDTTWTFSFTLPDGSINDGNLKATLTSFDVAGNKTMTYVDSTVFVVDNTDPAAFTVSTITTFGYNQHSGWINGETDSVSIVVPLDQTDATLLNGGDIYVQMRIPLRMASDEWVQVGTKDSIETTVDSVVFRTMAEISSALTPEGLAQGDSIVTRAILHDVAGNFTNGSESASKFVYDPNKMTIGANQITAGNILNVDTLVSNDTITVTWDDFDEPTASTASGLLRYEVAVEHVGDDSITQFINWVNAQTTPSWDTTLGLRHDNQYRVHIRAFDVAGNISDTLASNVFRRYNTAPVLAAMDSVLAYEDILWKDTLSVTDPDLATILSDTMNYYKIRTVGITGTVSADSARLTAIGIDSSIVSWTPLQADTGSYTITVWVRDVWKPDTFIDSVSFYIYVQAVNDTPVVLIIDPARQITFEEDDQDTVKYNMTSYATDADHDSTQLSWNPVLGTTPGITGFPKYAPPTIIFGPNTSEIAKQNIRQKYGIETTDSGVIGWVQPASEVKVQVTIDTSGGNTYATFDADSNYYISNYPVIFEVSDPSGALASDTTYLTITPKNDAPEFNKGLITLGDTVVTENDSILLDLGSYVTDVDDSVLYFRVSAITYSNKMSISDTSYNVDSTGYFIKFEPQKLWSDSSVIRVIAWDREDVTSTNAKSDTVTFTIDVIRVPRPQLALSVVQNNAFTNYYDIFVTDTIQKTVRCSVDVQGIPIPLDTVASFTYAGNYYFTSAGVYIFDVMAKGVVGDTSITNGVSLALAQSAKMWSGSSMDGRFRVQGEPGSVMMDRLLLISDSTLFGPYFPDHASYLLGNEFLDFSGPVQVSLPTHDDDLALYRRINGSNWEELPSVMENGLVWAWTEKMGYFRLGRKTIFVPELTNIHQNFPNPFNPVTTIEYDLGFFEGPNQKVNISVINLLGQHIKTLVNEQKSIGRHSIHWYGRNETDEAVASGIYFVRLITDGGIVKTRKITLMR